MECWVLLNLSLKNCQLILYKKKMVSCIFGRVESEALMDCLQCNCSNGDAEQWNHLLAITSRDCHSQKCPRNLVSVLLQARIFWRPDDASFILLSCCARQAHHQCDVSFYLLIHRMFHENQESLDKNRKCWKPTAGQVTLVQTETKITFWVEGWFTADEGNIYCPSPLSLWTALTAGHFWRQLTVN